MLCFFLWRIPCSVFFFFFFFNDTATTEIYTLSLHDALPISDFFNGIRRAMELAEVFHREFPAVTYDVTIKIERSEEHTSELQSRLHLVCRLLLEKKKKSPHRTSLTSSPAHGPSTAPSLVCSP